MASMRNWLNAEDGSEALGALKVEEGEKSEKGKRVVVVHCKAGKGRSGSMAISYLITHEGWRKEDALQRFTERRMRPGFGAGISIPSQKRWLDYVEQWANKGGRMYLERSVEVMEVHVWGLREGTKIDIEGYVEDGRKIKRFHTFHNSERDDLDRQEATIPPSTGPQKSGGGFVNVVFEATGRQNPMVATTGLRSRSKSPNPIDSPLNAGPTPSTPSAITNSSTLMPPEADLIRSSSASSASSTSAASIAAPQATSEVRINTIFRPHHRIILPSSDINLAVEQRKGWGNTVTSVAHVWFNCYFEGNGPKNWESQHTVASNDQLRRVDTHGFDETGKPRSHGSPKPDDGGVFTVDFDAMDGIKGSSRKGTRAFDRVAVVWKAVQSADSATNTASTEATNTVPPPPLREQGDRSKEVPNLVIPEPDPGESVTPLRGADWRGSSPIIAGIEKDQGENEQSKDPMEGSDDEDGAGGVRRGLVD